MGAADQLSGRDARVGGGHDPVELLRTPPPHMEWNWNWNWKWKRIFKHFGSTVHVLSLRILILCVECSSTLVHTYHTINITRTRVPYGILIQHKHCMRLDGWMGVVVSDQPQQSIKSILDEHTFKIM